MDLRAMGAAGALAACVWLAACNGGDDDPKPIEGPAKEVAVVVKRLERATARGDFRTICNDLFTADARVRAGGRGCPAQLRRTAGGVEEPVIEIERIDVRGNRAIADVRTRARGQRESDDRIELVRQRGRFRVAQLGSG